MRNRIVSAVKPRNTLAQPTSQMLYFPMRVNEGATADQLLDKGNTELASGAIDIGGTTTNMWSAKPAYFTPPGDQDEGQVATDAMQAFMRLDTLAGIGGLLIAADLTVSTAPTVDNVIVDFCNANAINGGYLWRLQSSNAMTVRNTPPGGSDGTVAAVTGMSFPYNKHIGIYFDCYTATPTCAIYEDAVQADQRNVTGTLPAGEAIRGLSLFSRRTTASTQDKICNATDTGYIGLRNLRIIRFEYDAASLISAILSEMVDYRNEDRLQTLVGR